LTFVNQYGVFTQINIGRVVVDRVKTIRIRTAGALPISTAVDSEVGRLLRVRSSSRQQQKKRFCNQAEAQQMEPAQILPRFEMRLLKGEVRQGPFGWGLPRAQRCQEKGS
jgi:hypothetical protein